MKLDVTTTDPITNAPMAIAIVAVSTKRTSCKVELKHAGRTLFVSTGCSESIRASSSAPMATCGDDTCSFSILQLWIHGISPNITAPTSCKVQGESDVAASTSVGAK